jgi:hypothetical protein
MFGFCNKAIIEETFNNTPVLGATGLCPRGSELSRERRTSGEALICGAGAVANPKQ